MVLELNNGKNFDDVIFGEEYENKFLYEIKNYIVRNVFQVVVYLYNQVLVIIYRDIKFENILVLDDLKRICLWDFGISICKFKNNEYNYGNNVRWYKIVWNIDLLGI